MQVKWMILAAACCAAAVFGPLAALWWLER